MFRLSDIYRKACRHLFDTLNHVVMNFWHTATTFIQHLSEFSLTVSVDKPRMFYIFLKTYKIDIKGLIQVRFPQFHDISRFQIKNFVSIKFIIILTGIIFTILRLNNESWKMENKFRNILSLPLRINCIWTLCNCVFDFISSWPYHFIC